MIVSIGRILSLFLFILPGFSYALNPPGPLVDAALEMEIEAAMKVLKTPGLSVGVIDLKTNRTYMKGFGFRDLEQRLPVTENTLFMIGSTTKAFTATGLKILAERGKINLHEPVRKILPEFELKDEVASRLATPVDLLSHQTGLPRHDLVWYGDNAQPRAFFMNLLKELEPSATFRQKWQYNNLMYMAAGVVTEKITGQSWENFTQSEILVPLGMTRSNFSVKDMVETYDHALPYSRDENEGPVRTEFHHIGALAPAGAINSSAAEMLKWMKFNLKSPTLPSLLSPTALDSVHRPVSALGRRFDQESGYVQYALGWAVLPYRGHNWVTHNGGIDGFITHVGFMPDNQLAVVVFANSDATGIPDVVAKMIYDELLGAPKTDWLGRHVALLKASREASKKEREKIPESSAPLLRSSLDFVGSYSHPAYREIDIFQRENGLLGIKFRGFSMNLSHIANGAFVADGKIGIDTLVTDVVFQMNERGEVESLRIELEPSVSPVLFQRSKSSRPQQP